MSLESRWDRRLDDLRSAFDRSFGEPFEAPSAAPAERVLLLVVAGANYAVRLTECAGVTRAPAVHRLPSTEPAFAGVAVVKGTLVPVYRLATLLRVDPLDAPAPAARVRDASAMEGQWLLMTRGSDRIGLLVDGIDGPEPALLDEPSAEIVQAGGVTCRLLRMDRVLEDLHRLLEPASPLGEAR
ncbi:MAG: chemotaxis protein CheW [Vicinamibacterales bacterium]